MIGSPTRVKITVNTLSQLVGRISSSATTFVLTILLARSLGTEGYGDFSKITTYVSFFYLFADFGLNAALLQLKSEDKRFSFNHLLSLRIILSLILVFISVSLLSFFPQESRQGYTSVVRMGIIFYSLSIISQAFITTSNAIFQEKLRYELAMLAIIGGSLIRLVITIVFGTGSLMGAVGCFLLGSLATAGLAYPLVKNLEPSLSPHFSLKHMLSILKSSLPLGITLVFNLIYFRIDSILLTITQPTADVGIYNLAYSFFEFALVLPVFFLNALYPLLLKRKEVSLEAFFVLAKKAAVVLLVSSVICMIGVWISAPMLTLIKPEFAPGIDALRVLSLSLPCFFITSLTMWMLITLRKRKTLVAIYGFSMLINIVANTIFLPRIGFMAAAWITVLGETFILLCSSLVVLNLARQTINLRRILAS